MSGKLDDLAFSIDNDWEQVPYGIDMDAVKGVAIDSQDRAYIIGYGDPAIISLDNFGNVSHSINNTNLIGAHGICLDDDNNIYVADRYLHVVVKFSYEGKVLLTLGTRSSPSPELSGAPFNGPTGVGLSEDKDIYVVDGYGNAKVHKYSPDGSHLFSWGGYGNHPGEFCVPHGICVDSQGMVFVADQGNHRVQMFDPDGEYIREYSGLNSPSGVTVDMQGNIYVTESRNYISIISSEGDITSRLTIDPISDGGESGFHAISIDSLGSLYFAQSAKKGIRKYNRER